MISYALETVQWAVTGALLGYLLRPVFRRRGHYHRRANRRDS